jgi:hypothetical protein
MIPILVLVDVAVVVVENAVQVVYTLLVNKRTSGVVAWADERILEAEEIHDKTWIRSELN